MGYKSTEDCINDLEKHGYLIRIKEEVDPELEMAAIHLRVFEHNGPALLFENIKGCKFYREARNTRCRKRRSITIGEHVISNSEHRDTSSE